MNEGMGRLRSSLRPRPSRGQIGGALLLALLGFATAVVVVLGIRIFGNAAAIRRHLFRA